MFSVRSLNRINQKVKPNNQKRTESESELYDDAYYWNHAVPHPPGMGTKT